jgi:hypothetical protein
MAWLGLPTMRERREYARQRLAQFQTVNDAKRRAFILYFEMYADHPFRWLGFVSVARQPFRHR